MDISEMNQMYESLGIKREVRGFAAKTEQTPRERFESIGAVAEYNQMKVIKGMQDNRVSDIHSTATTGYGYSDLEHDTLEDMYANVFHDESALVRPRLISGTHALHAALSGNLRPRDELLSPADKLYGTLKEVIGIRDSVRSPKGYRMSYRQVELLEDSPFDHGGIAAALNEKTKLVIIQRSKSYAAHLTLPVKWIGELISFIKDIKLDVICMMDNCYGEFVETIESTDVGADMIVGSLTKNPGGGLVPIDGYIVGGKDYIEWASYRLNASGLGKEVGVSPGLNQQLYQGLFLSPVMVLGAPKGTIFAASIYEQPGCAVMPSGSESCHDIIQVTTFGTPEGVISFCKGIQAATPVDGYVMPKPWDMPGYNSPIIMTAGAFVQGSSTELPTGGPIKPPYAVYFQRGLTWYHAKLGILKSLQQLSDDRVLRILR